MSTCGCEFDQSPYVTNSIRGLVTEGLLGAVLTGLMVLIFLRDWRSALIVVMNIPFALLTAVILLWATGQTINIMTLGGLALAVGVSGGRGDGSDREHPHADAFRGFRGRARCWRRAANGDRATAFDVVHSRGIRSFVLHGRREPAAFRSAVAGRRLLDDCVLPALQQPGSGVFDMAHEGSASRRRAARILRASAVRSIRAIWASCCDCAGPWCSVISPRRSGCSTSCCRAWEPRSFPMPMLRVLRIRLRAPAGTRVEETERIVLRALDVIQQEAGSGQR